MRVTFVVPALLADRFTGGILCVLEHANRLVDRGHDVQVLSLSQNDRPQWIDLRARQLPVPRFSLGSVLGRTAREAVRRRLGRPDPEREAAAMTALVSRLAASGVELYRRAAHLEVMRSHAPQSDVTIATAVTTALPVALYGKGVRAYFMQHYEPFTVSQYADQALAVGEAELSVRLPLRKIANSSWCSRMIAEHTGDEAPVCLNAIDHGTFYSDGRPPDAPYTVVSYGGREAPWKGFREAAEAIRLAREQIPDLRWRVYGGALLPPDNPIAPYEDLGFVTGAPLRRLYSEAHAVLCPSWFESFPLFPLEAMACGSAVVTTPYGTEDYVRDGENAVVVPARGSREMADALVSLWRDPARRAAIAARAAEDARAFTWERAGDRMAAVLEELARG